MRAYERFLEYIKHNTKSSEDSGTHPSTKEQFSLAEALAKELTELGCKDVTLTDSCYVYAKLPASAGYEKCKKIGFIAHIDTSPDFSGEGVRPQIIENYDGSDIPLGESGLVLSPSVFSNLDSLKGRTLITTSGDTLLGADDKAGISEIMTLIEQIQLNSIPHGNLSFAFTPDEEIGAGADLFDVEKFGAELAYTVDGGEEQFIEYENFNAATATFNVKGVNVHPGSAKGKMINAALVGCEINNMLPSAETPAMTEGYEGFYHMIDLEGSVESATVRYIVRDHSATAFESRLATLKLIEKVLCEKYGNGTVTLQIKESYRNMKEKILPVIEVVDNAMDAIRMAGLEPAASPIRGGTDGARLSFMGLPCPNLGTGGYAYHGPFEHISVEGMDKIVEILTNIVKIYAKGK